MEASRDESPEGVAFLTALLVRYPEIGSARLSHAGHQMRLDFYLHHAPSDEEWVEFQQRLQLHWRVFFQLQKLHPEVSAIERGPAPGPELAYLHDEDGYVEVITLHVIRDLASLTLEEVRMVVTLVNEFFVDVLALNEQAPQEDPEHQDEVIHRCLERVRATPGEATLTGFRDDMRVLIYSSQEEM